MSAGSLIIGLENSFEYWCTKSSKRVRANLVVNLHPKSGMERVISSVTGKFTRRAKIAAIAVDPDLGGPKRIIFGEMQIELILASTYDFLKLTKSNL